MTEPPTQALQKPRRVRAETQRQSPQRLGCWGPPAGLGPGCAAFQAPLPTCSSSPGISHPHRFPSGPGEGMETKCFPLKG